MLGYRRTLKAALGVALLWSTWSLLKFMQNTTPGLETFLKQKKCASWVSNRRIAFVDIATMNTYNNNKKDYRGGEYYMSATLDYALRQNGFAVDRISHKKLQNNVTFAKTLDKYHLVIGNGPYIWSEFNVSPQPWRRRCKIRSFAWWGYYPEVKKTFSAIGHRQWLTAFPPADFYGTFLGFFVHSALRRPPDSRRGKVGFLLGKNPGQIRLLAGAVDALLKDGFELHSTCNDCVFQQNVIRHDNVGPQEFSKLLSRCAFMIGGGSPFDSPSPMEALANGVAFINPIQKNVLPSNTTVFSLSTGPTAPRTTQHVPLSMLSEPYVYNVHLQNLSHVVHCANQAVHQRFSSFVSADYSVSSMVARTCQLLEDDSICQCEHCHGSLTIRNTNK